MTIAPEDQPIPSRARRIAGARPIWPVWLNNLGGVTCAIGREGTPIGADPVEYLKWSPHHHEIDLVGEAERLRWARDFIPCPEVIDAGSQPDGMWLHTKAVQGSTAVARHWSGATADIVNELGRALRHFHDRVPARDCPWTWSVADRLAVQGVEAERIAAWPQPPGAPDPVVCTADACAPNTLMRPVGTENSPRWCGYVDLGDIGVADRWADLSVALWSLELNFGTGWEEGFLAGYGIELDRAKCRYYREVYDAINAGEVGPEEDR